MTGDEQRRLTDATFGRAVAPEDEQDKKARELHIQLITFLFSITIGRLAIEASRIAAVARQDWLDEQYWPSYTHLLLASIVVILSWIGWRSSGFSAKGRLSPSVFSSAFMELCVDIALVVLYFRLVSGAELAEFSSHKCLNTTDEAFTLMCIFFLYTLWDICSKAFATSLTKQEHGSYWERGWASFGAACFSLTAYALSFQVEELPTAVCCFDFSLMALAVWFRETKVLCSRQRSAGRIKKSGIAVSVALLSTYLVLLWYSLSS